MSLSESEILQWARYLEEGRQSARELDRITSTCAGLSLEDAYRIQAEGIRLRTTRSDDRVVGLKMGLTSRAKREQMSLHSPVFGRLTDRMRITGKTFSLRAERTIHPKIEPEIAFQIGRELKHPVTRAGVLEACRGVCAAMEILDSRYVGFKYFSLPDVVADNSSGAFFALGEWSRDLGVLDRPGLLLTMQVDGREIARAEAAEISGDPVNSVIQLVELLHGEGRSLPEGSIVLAGAATAAVGLEAGRVYRLEASGLSPVEVAVVE